MEENYQNIIYSVFRQPGAEIHNEVHINNGRIDTAIVNRDARRTEYCGVGGGGNLKIENSRSFTPG